MACGHHWFYDEPEIETVDKNKTCPDCERSRTGEFKDYTKSYTVI